MKNFHKINTGLGWLLFLIALIVYTKTVEPTVSYWDSGEFISSSYGLQIPHAPGAPFYLLIGKMFSFMAMGDLSQIAFWVNMVSVVSSALTIAFLFWIIIFLGRKLFDIKRGEENLNQSLALILGGTIGALTYAFSDSFWFSAVEAEVYALSSLMTAFVVWAILKWDIEEDASFGNKWLLLIAYVIGLSIGVHPLNILAVPSICLIYYFKKYKISTKGVIYTFGVSALLIVLLMFGLRLGLVGMAKYAEIFSVNSLSLPFGSGTFVFSVLIAIGLGYVIYTSYRRKMAVLNTAMLSVVYLIIGFASYGIIIIRSQHNPPLDPNNPENLPNFIYYLNMEQYGTRPLLYGPYFNAQPTGNKDLGPVYAKGEEAYEIAYRKFSYEYNDKDMTVFPRIYSSDQTHKDAYAKWLGLGPHQQPDFGDNMRFMFSYQLGHMYWRYFLWNFAGKAGDNEGADWITPWESTKALPAELAANKGRNNYFMLPLLLGIIGLLFNFKKDKKSFLAIITLFLITGVILVLYLNSPSVEPRERDYIYVGSFFAFAIWIGFGAMAIYQYLLRWFQSTRMSMAVASLVALSIPGIMLLENWNDHDRSDRYYSLDSAINTLESCPPNAILFTGGDNDTYPLWYAQEVEGIRQDVRVVVSTYFNADWNIEQMKRDAYSSKALPISFEKEDFKRGVNDYIYLNANPKFDSGISLIQYLKLLKEEHPALVQKTADGNRFSITPSKTLSLNIDKNKVLESGIIPENMTNLLQDTMSFVVKENGFTKGDLMQLDLIANNNWERPICYTYTGMVNSGLTFDDYLVQQGQALRLLPVKNPSPESDFIDSDTMYTNLMKKFKWRGLDDKSIYYSDYYKRQLITPRSNFNSLAKTLMKEGDFDRARKVLNQSIAVIPDDTIPYDVTTPTTVQLLLNLDEDETAKEIAHTMMDRADEKLTYYIDEQVPVNAFPIQQNLYIMNALVSAFKRENLHEEGDLFEKKFIKHLRKLEES